MAELKTKRTDADVQSFILGIEDEVRREDCLTILPIMRRIVGVAPKMWGTSIVGFGSYHYKYASGRTGDWFLTGFSPRKQDLTIYIMPGLERHESILAKLGKHKTGKSCLYLKRLADVDIKLLEKLIATSVGEMRETYETLPE